MSAVDPLSVPAAAAGSAFAPAREAFATRLGVLLATLGSAVGLGNIWKFPTLTGANGGAAFLCVYLLATFAVALPVMIAELAIGRRARADAVTSFERLAPAGSGRRWRWVGGAGVLAAVLLLAFYSEVAGWVFAYLADAVSGTALSTDAAANAARFGALSADPLRALGWQWLVLAGTALILACGVTRGIEAVTRRLMPVLFLLLALLAVRALLLPGAAEGLKFLFAPDFSKLTAGVVLTALGLAFFKLSLGIGAMVTYGSYFRADQDIPRTALRVMLADLSVSLLAGIAIFPAVFSFGVEPSAGPALVFMTLPAVFAQLPFGGLLLALFFALMAIAATGAMLSILEVPVAWLVQRGWPRPRAALLATLAVALPGVPAALSQGVLADATLFGRTAFELYDFASSGVLMPLVAIATALFVGRTWTRTQFADALGGPAGRPSRLAFALRVLLRWVAPVAVAVVLVRGWIG